MKFISSVSIALFVFTMADAQSHTDIEMADSFYFSRNWAGAKRIYVQYLPDTSTNSMYWNRLGFCDQHLGLYSDAVSAYNKALLNNPAPPIKSSASIRMAMVYSLMNETGPSTEWLLKSTVSGYNPLNDLDSLDEFKNLRTSENFKTIRKKIFGLVYPCSLEPRNHDFDFWIGDWSCYRTGTQVLSGYSHVETIAGGCAILENYSSTQAYTGKSFNFYDTASRKWQQDWIGSGGPADRQHFYNGEFNNGAMHFIYETTNPKGEKIKGNFIFYFIDRDTVRQYQDVMDDNGKTISVTYDLTYLRKK
jgi:tetratricopeptide (TPR) repeat protein